MEKWNSKEKEEVDSGPYLNTIMPQGTKPVWTQITLTCFPLRVFKTSLSRVKTGYVCFLNG